MLAGIFEQVLSRNRKLNLVNERISKSPELKDQQVTQFVIHDGWIGIALGPETPEPDGTADEDSVAVVWEMPKASRSSKNGR